MSSQRAAAPWWGLAASGVAIGLAELLAGLAVRRFGIGGTPSPVVALGNGFIDHTPSWLKNFAVSVFGTHDKTALAVGMVVVVVALSVLIGALSARRLVAGLLLFAGLAGVVLAAVLTRPGAGMAAAVPTAIGALAGMYVLSTIFGQNGATAGGGVDRRTVLAAGVGAGVFAVLGTLAGRALSSGAHVVQAARSKFVLPKVAQPVTVPASAGLAVQGISPLITPTDSFYRIDTAFTVPQVDPAGWRLRVHGMVDREVSIGWEELLRQPMQQAVVTLMCVSNEVGGDLNGTAVWTGFPVRELLQRAGVRSGADMVLSRSADGFTAGTPLRALTDDRPALLAVAMNGVALPAEHGFPVRLVVPGLYGYVSATKWVTDLKVTTFAADQGYWTPRGWSALGPVKMSSRIDVPRDGSTVAVGKVAVAGVAWEQGAGIRAVEVQVDAGEWQPARLGTSIGINAWRQWVWEWSATAGTHTLQVRARDEKGNLQDARIAPPEPDGSTGYHTISVTVRSD